MDCDLHLRVKYADGTENCFDSIAEGEQDVALEAEEGSAVRNGNPIVEHRFIACADDGDCPFGHV